MKKGFTLIEMLVVIGIIGILIAVMLTSFGGATESARAAKCVTNLKSLAQAANNYKMKSGKYPLAGSLEALHKLSFEEAPAWISWLSRTKYNSPRSMWEMGSAGSHQKVDYCPFYGTPDKEDLRWAFEHGQIWDACGRNAEIFVCPTHRKICQAWKIGSPVFSYVMNAKFGLDSTNRQGVDAKYGGNRHGIDALWRADKKGNLKRISAERTLMFADIHMDNDMKGGKLGTAESDPRVDQVLTYKATVKGVQYPNSKVKSDGSKILYSSWNGDPEHIGFTHKGSDGRYRAHVAFADGHVEKFVEPGHASALNAEQITALLCEGIDFGATGNNYTPLDNLE